MRPFRPDPDLLAERLAALEARPARVAVEGIDCSGKTTLADLLGTRVSARGRSVIRVGADGFLRSRAERYRLGPDSPEGYALHSVDYPMLRAALLDPLGPGGDLTYRTAVRDGVTDLPVETPPQTAPEDAVLIVDGVFLQRPEVRECWDLVVWVEVSFQEALRRALLRDAERFGGREEARARYVRRYLPGQRRYLEECRPHHTADVVVVSG
jgi:uridine kinase